MGRPCTHDTLYIVAAYNPLEEPSGGPNFHKFSDDVLYSIHIARGDTSLVDKVRYDVSFTTSSINYVDPADLTQPVGGGKEFFSQLSGQTQTYTVTKTEDGKQTVVAQNIPVAPVNIGPRTNTVAYAIPSGLYNDAYAATFIHNAGAEGQFWAGPRDDGFYVDLGGVFDLANLRGPGVVATPVGALLFWFFSANAGWLYVTVAMSYFLTYEWLHFAYHLPEGTLVGRLPFVAALRRHHTRHHDLALMGKYNFNITFPICDWLYGTTYRAARD